MKKKKFHLSYNGRKALYGYGFIAIWIVGFICFFARQMVMTFIYSANDIKFLSDGMELTYNNFSVYKFAFLDDPTLLRQMVSCFTDLIYKIPLIIILSLLIAVLLNNEFFGRTFFRAVFFIPVIVTSGVVLSIIKGDSTAAVATGEVATSMLQVSDLSVLLSNFNLPEQISDFIMELANTLFDLLWKMGIQILLFIAALKTVPPSVYEAADIEGASRWDCFWKITVPMVSPVILLTVIYSIIDSFTDTSNPIMERILTDAQYLKYTEASVLAVIYFVLAIIFIAIVYAVLGKILPYSHESR